MERGKIGKAVGFCVSTIDAIVEGYKSFDEVAKELEINITFLEDNIESNINLNKERAHYVLAWTKAAYAALQSGDVAKATSIRNAMAIAIVGPERARTLLGISAV